MVRSIVAFDAETFYLSPGFPQVSVVPRFPSSPGFRRPQVSVVPRFPHDVERILDHYDHDVILTSPVALKLLNGSGTVEGKSALREYFLSGLQAFPELHFDLIEVLWGLETIVLFYFNNVRGSKTAEVLLLNSAGRISRVWANYDH